MPLTTTQLATLRTHVQGNTNPVNVDGTPVPINTLPVTTDNAARIAAWYNLPALATDAQAFAAPLEVWRANVSITDLNAAINWGQNPAGATAADQNNNWLRWQSMCWVNSLDLTDNQVRAGVASVWGSASASNTAIKAVGIGRRVGTRFERLFAGASRGPNGAAADPDVALNGRVSAVYGQQLSGNDVQNALAN